MPESLNYIHLFFFIIVIHSRFSTNNKTSVSGGHINKELFVIKRAIIVKISVRRHDGYFVM